jgi:hypothetical protein
MERKEFLCRTLQLGLGSCALAGVADAAAGLADDTPAKATPPATPDELTQARGEADFVRHWVSDLLDTAEAELPRELQVKLIEGCGRGCFRRHEFKRAIAEQGKGDVDKLVAAYKKNFEVWREGETVHVRYGEVSSRCYCPVVKDRPAKPNDLHCECTRTTHQSIFETALGRPVRVEVLDTLRRGGRTCHFVAHLA